MTTSASWSQVLLPLLSDLAAHFVNKYSNVGETRNCAYKFQNWTLSRNT